MVTEFLIHKWQTNFVSNDINKDGYMSIEDANLFADRFTKHHNMTGERAARLRSDFRAYWNEKFMYNREKIYLETYLELMTKEYLEDKNKFKDRMVKACQTVVDIFDVNDDGFISYDEFMAVCECWGIKTFDKKFLDAYPQFIKGYVAKEAFRNSWVAYLTNTDDKNIEVEKPVLFGFRIIDEI